MDLQARLRAARGKKGWSFDVYSKELTWGVAQHSSMSTINQPDPSMIAPKEDNLQGVSTSPDKQKPLMHFFYLIETVKSSLL